MIDFVPYGPEGPESEWKERLPRPERVAKTLAAFANGCGGSLWVGVRDSGQAAGVSDPRLIETTLRVIAEELLEPLPEFRFVHHRWRGRDLVELCVSPGSELPVGTLMPDGGYRVYVRDGSSTRPAAPHTVRAMRRRPHRRCEGELDPRSQRILRILAQRRDPTVGELARFARMGRRAARRIVVSLVQRGLVGENDRHRLWLTPLGHRSAG